MEPSRNFSSSRASGSDAVMSPTGYIFTQIFIKLHPFHPAGPEMPVQSARETVRSVSRTLLSVRHWQARLILWAAGISVGAAAVGFAWLADIAQSFFRHCYTRIPAWPWIVAPAGFAAISWVTRRFFPGAEGSGIPQTIFALRPEAGEREALLLSPKIVGGRIVLAGAALLCG